MGLVILLQRLWCVPNFDYSLIIEGTKSVCKRERLFVRSHGERLKGSKGSEMRLATDLLIMQLFRPLSQYFLTLYIVSYQP